jgi:hypothetical protein
MADLGAQLRALADRLIKLARQQQAREDRGAPPPSSRWNPPPRPDACGAAIAQLLEALEEIHEPTVRRCVRAVEQRYGLSLGELTAHARWQAGWDYRLPLDFRAPKTVESTLDAPDRPPSRVSCPRAPRAVPRGRRGAPVRAGRQGAEARAVDLGAASPRGGRHA